MKKIKFSLQPPISPEQYLIGSNLSFKTTRNINITKKTMRLRKSLAVFNNLRDISKELLEISILNKILNRNLNNYDR